MIYYISENTSHLTPDNDIVLCNSEQGLIHIGNYYSAKLQNNDRDIGCDLETNGLDAYINDILLCGIGDTEIQFIIDATTCKVCHYFPKHMELFEWILHNGKFDSKFLELEGTYIKKMFDTMLGAQKLYQGNAWNAITNPLGVRFNLPAVIEKILKIAPEMNKDIRNDFIGIQPKNFRPEIKHLKYLKKDLTFLPPLKAKLQTMLRKRGIKYLDKYGAYIPFCTGHMELQGFRIDKPLWLKNIENNKQLKYEFECKLDAAFRKLRDENSDGLQLIGGKYDRIRNAPVEIQQYDIFGTELKHMDYLKMASNSKGKKPPKPKNTAVINWKSTDEITKIFAILELPLPVDHKSVTETIPTYYIEKGKIKLFKDYKFTTKAGNLQELINTLPNHPAVDFFKLLIQYREIETALNTFGENILEKINPVTGRLHSIFRTDSTTTGRFGSGESKSPYPNFQNWPRKANYRNAMLPKSDDRSIVTLDLSGAEVTIMCNIAHDVQLYEWAVKNDDAHSPIATACWRNIYMYRLAKKLDIIQTKQDFINNHSWLTEWVKDDLFKNYSRDIETSLFEEFDNACTFTISKTENKEFRQTFKNLTFAAVYNVGEKKAGKILNIPQDEAAIALWTIKSSIPDTFDFVERVSELALQQGWLTINDRIGTRILFPDVLRILEKGDRIETLPFRTRVEIEGAARNCLIQGTQADMIKEAFVEVTLYLIEHGINGTAVNKVHDELVMDVTTNLTEHNCIYWVSDKVKHVMYPDREVFLPVNKGDWSKVILQDFSDEDIKLVTFQEFCRLTMVTAASRYLKHYKMGSSSEVHPHWVK